ncbi:MAG TPA: hypothetical protein IAB02_04150 [Candidatus Pullichristensenella excrementigallinarum]|uniref:Uncharacterized protein n=1 Tax=Candidatus Pullichristensenella excrementigallinarum TaxID=2840907 RepID=A0A9D1IDA2_9FIRM|nr:hypothetical protein [Candidatus Pullichristensenella excrementigallinarum]
MENMRIPDFREHIRAGVYFGFRNSAEMHPANALKPKDVKPLGQMAEKALWGETFQIERGGVYVALGFSGA